MLKVVVMLQRVMGTHYQTLRAYLPSPDRLDPLWEIGWEDTGGVVLALGGIAFMALFRVIRSR